MSSAKHHKVYICRLLIILLGLVLVACGALTRKEANEAFLKENPTFTIIHSDTGEGWDGVVNYHFEYKKPGDERVNKEAWTFVRQADGTWKVTGKWVPED